MTGCSKNKPDTIRKNNNVDKTNTDCKRVTVNLESGTERLLSEVIHRYGYNYNEALNQAIIKGLAELLSEKDNTPFIQPSFPMRLQPGCDPAHLNSLSDGLETDAFLAVTHRLGNNLSNDP